MTREEAINKWTIPALRITWTEKKCNEIIKALEQESCEDCISREAVLEIVNNPLNIRFDAIIKKLPSVQPKEIYNKGWKDGAEAIAYHVELCEEENPTIPLSVIEDIKAEIENNMESIIGKYDCKTPERQMPSRKIERNEARKECLEIIDKHIAERGTE